MGLGICINAEDFTCLHYYVQQRVIHELSLLITVYRLMLIVFFMIVFLALYIYLLCGCSHSVKNEEFHMSYPILH